MKIVNLGSGVTSLTNKEIETNLQRLFIDLKMAITDSDWEEDASYAKSLINTMCGSTKITVLAQRPDLTETIIREVELWKLLEYSTPNECVMRLDYDGVDARLRGNIDIAVDGSLKLNQTTKLLLSVSGKVSTATLDIYTMDLPLDTNHFVKLEEIHFNANVEKAINTAGMSAIMIPIDKLTSCKVYYNNGRQISIEAEELKQRMLDTEDPICVYNGRVFFGTFNYAALSVESCWKVEMSINSTESIHVQKIVRL